MFTKKEMTYKSSRGQTYYIEKQLKTQSFFSLHYATDSNGKECIAKIIDLSKVFINEKLLTDFLKIEHDYGDFENQNILKVYDKILKDNKLVIITSDHELISLEDIIFKDNPYDEDSVREIVLTIMDAYLWIKKNKTFGTNQEFYHNICVSNMFLKSAELVIGGWDTGELSHFFYISNFMNLNYKPPEAIMGEEVNNDQAVVWMIGIFFYNMLFSMMPFNLKTRKESIQILKQNAGKNLKFPPNKPISIQAKNFILKALEFDKTKRMTFEQMRDDVYLEKEKKKKQIFNHKNNYSIKQHFSQDFVKTFSILNEPKSNSLPHQTTMRLSYQNYEEINVKRPIGTRILTDLDFDFCFDSDINVESGSNTFSWSNLSFDYEKVERVEENETGYTYFKENNSNESFLFYIYEKNKIILLIDSMNKIRECEFNKTFQEFSFDFFYLQILILKKASIQNIYLIEVMRNNVNVFCFQDFEEINKHEEYSHLMHGFTDLNASLKTLLKKLVEDGREIYDHHFISLKQIERYRTDDIHEKIQEFQVRLTDYYGDKKLNLREEERLLLIQVILLIKYGNDIDTYFMFQSFRTTRDWVVFLKNFSSKKVKELENLL